MSVEMQEMADPIPEGETNLQIKRQKELHFRRVLLLISIGIWSWIVGWAWYDAFRSVYEYLIPFEDRDLPKYTFAWATILTGPFVVVAWATGFVPF
jgi:hypothetical protein